MGQRARAGLLACVGISALAHVALIGYLAPAGGGSGGAQRQPLAAGAAHVRVAALPVEQPLTVDRPMLTPSGAAVPVAPVAPESAMPAPTAPSAPVFDERDYVPRPKLSVAPVAQQPVLLSWPSENAPPAGLYTGVLSLFIDEFGTVQRVRVEGDELPPVLYEQARAAFVGLRFSPGQVDGRDVKSRIRVEVRFEADPRMVRGALGS